MQDCEIQFDTDSIVVGLNVHTFASEPIITIIMAADTIGKLIEEEVRRQGWRIGDFAEKIYCSRENVYALFKRYTIDVAQLQLISKVLNHDFFLDIISNPGLVDITNPEIKKDLLNRRAVAQFFDVMPKVLKNLNIETSIVMPIMRNEFNDPLPDYGLSDFAIFFTVGERLLDRFTPTNFECFDVQTEVAFKNHIVDIWHNKVHHSWFVDVKLDYKTEEEWREILVYLLDNWMPAIKMN